MPDITLENGIVVEGFPDNPTSEDLAKLDRIKKKYQTVSQPTPTTPSETAIRSPLQSGLIGASRGATFGLAPKIIAGLESIRSNRPYEDVLQEATGMYKQASEQNPASYLTGEIGAGIATPIGQAATGAKLGRLATIGAGTGALSGLGYSEGETAGEVARDVTIGGLLGGGLPVLGAGLSKAREYLPKISDIAIKKGLQGGLGVSSELLTEAEKNPKAVEKIMKVYAGENIKKDIIPAKANIVESFMSDNPIAKRAIKNSKLAVESIPDDTMINKNLAINELNKQIKILEKSEGVSDVRNEAIKMLSDKIKAFDNLPENIPGNRLKPILQGIDDDIEKAGGWQNPLKNNLYRDGLENARGALDKDLKQQVPKYKQLMKKVSQDYQLSNNLTKRFATEKGFDENKIQNALNAQLRKTDTNLQKDFKRLEAFGKAGGYQDDLKLNEFLNDMALKQDIERYGGKGSSISNRLTGLFTMAGTSLGGLPGGAIGTGLGSIVGSEVEKQGGQLALKGMELTKRFRTPSLSPIPEATQRGFQVQQGVQKGLLDQFLTENAGEVRRKREMESKFQQENLNRVGK
jgi:hypothetical protein